MEINIKEREYKKFKDIDGVIFVNDVYLCNKEDFMKEFDSICKTYDGRGNMIESVTINGIELTFWEMRLIDALCRNGEYEYLNKSNTMENKSTQEPKENPLSRPANYPLDVLLAELKYGRPAESQNLLDELIEIVKSR